MGAIALDMSKETIYERIIDWEKKVGESFVNYFGPSIYELTFIMFEQEDTDLNFARSKIGG